MSPNDEQIAKQKKKKKEEREREEKEKKDDAFGKILKSVCIVCD